ncbi:MAG: hypothetical protein L0Z54_06925 [Thermoplasmata archaeon]|nr:hypothetical protein [Thermoplasmata archaeon]
MGQPDVEVREGATRLVVPDPGDASGPGDSSMPVFYNPVAVAVRDMNVSLFRALERRNLDAMDLLAGTGASGIRLLNEVRAEWSMSLNDINPLATRYIRRNLRINGLSARVMRRPAHRALDSGSYDHIDVDPFGSPVPFLPFTVATVRHRGTVGFTATDTAVLCGTYPAASRRRYGIQTEKTPFRHEVGVRALVSYVVRRFAEQERAARPLIAFAEEHFYRAVFHVESGSRRSDALLGSLGYVGYRQETGERWVQEDPARGLTGPIWTGPLGDRTLIGRMRPVSERTEWLVALLLEEVDQVPYHFNTDEFGSRLGGLIPRLVDAVQTLRDAGFSASPTHFSPTGFKTDATFEEAGEAFASGAAR